MTELVNVLVEGDREPLGFIEITVETTLEDARKSIEADVENLPKSYRFLFLNRDILVKVSLRQESKTKAMKALTKNCLVIRPVVENTNPDAKEESSVSLDKYLNKAQQTIDTSKVNVVIDSEHTQAIRKFWHEMDHHIKESTSPKPAREKKKRLSHSARSGSNLSSDCESDDSTASSHSNTPEVTPQKTLLAVDSISFSSQHGEDEQPKQTVGTPLSPTPSQEQVERVPHSEQPLAEQPATPAESEPQLPVSSLPSDLSLLKKDSSADSDTTITEETSPLSISPNSSYGTIPDAYEDDLARSSALLRSRMSKSRSTILKLEGFIQNRPSAQSLAEKKILDMTTISDISSLTPSPNQSLSFSELMIKSPLIKPDLTWRVELASGKTQGGITTLEFLDKYEYYYKECFSTERHSNFTGEHPKSGHVVVSVMDESPYQNGPPFIFPAIIRSEKYDDRVFLDLNKKPKNKTELIRALKTSFPHLLSNIKFSRNESPALVADLIKYEQDQIIKNMKVGVLYCAESQTTDDEMFNNNTITDKFQEFLDFLGDKVELQGFKGYNGGLDVKTNTTGTHSVYTKFLGLEMMFHVSSMLPFFPSDPQQVERKRHLGNDIVVIVFKEGKTPFEPSVIKSQFNHVFAVVSPAHAEDIPAEERSSTYYQVAICSKRDVPPFGPAIHNTSIFKKDIHFRDFLLTKLLNAERASMVAPIFSKKMEYARKQLLTYMCTNPYPQPEEDANNNNSSDSDLENTLIYHGVASMSQVTVSVKGHDFNFKSGVDPNTPISQFIEKLEKRVPLTQHGYGLYCDGELMDKDATWMKYKYNFHKMKVEFYPFISPGEPKQIKHLDNEEVPLKRRFLTFSKKNEFRMSKNLDTDPTFVQKANPLYSSPSDLVEEALPLGSRPKSKTVSGPSAAPSSLTNSPTMTSAKAASRAVQRSGSDTVGGVVSILVRSPTVEISIKVHASSTVASLLEKIQLKFPDNSNWKLTKDGKTLNLTDTVDSLRSGFEAVTVDFGPDDKSRKTLRKSFLH